MLLVSVYVGYFSAGGGFLVMALFGICGVRNIHEMNALKVVTATVSIGIPAITFIVARKVAWQFCLEMGVVAGLGGYLAAHYSPRVNQKAMRWGVATDRLRDRRIFLCARCGPPRAMTLPPES